MKIVTYREQLIKEWEKGDITYYLYGEGGDIDIYKAKTISEAKKQIDKFYKRNGGFYDEEGKIYQD